MSSFVDVRRLGFSARPPQNFFTRLTRRQAAPYPILQDITFSLNLGDWVTLYGAPGAGKTTLLQLLAGKLSPSEGTIATSGQPELVSALEMKSSTRSATEALQEKIIEVSRRDSPLILLDDVADTLGVPETKRLLLQDFKNRTVIIATRFPATAEALGLPVLLMHRGSLACHGTCDEMGRRVAAPRTLNAWIEGIRYDIFREIKKHPGVADVRLEVDGRYRGQRLAITLKSSRYLPALYDLVSRVSVVRLEEVPVKLEDILKKL